MLSSQATSTNASIEKLKNLTSSILTLLAHSQSSILSLNSSQTATSSSQQQQQQQTLPHDIPAVPLLHETALLVKAHTTKLALLLTQSADLDQTASATCTVLNIIQSSILPSFMVALELLRSQDHGKTLLRAATGPLLEIFKGLEDMISSIPNAIEEHQNKSSKQKRKNQKSNSGMQEQQQNGTIYPSTGIIWSAVEKLASLKSKGLSGLISDKLESDLQMIEDATFELKDFLSKQPSLLTSPSSVSSPVSSNNTEGGEDDDGGNHNDDDSDVDYDDGYDSEWEDFTSSQTSPQPTSSKKKKSKRKPLPEATRTGITTTLTKLKTLSILFSAIIKKRLLNPHGPTLDPACLISPPKATISRLEKLAELSAEVAGLVDDVVIGFYEWESYEGYLGDKEAQKKLVEKAVSLASLAKIGWNGKEDGSTRWFENCISALQR